MTGKQREKRIVQFKALYEAETKKANAALAEAEAELARLRREAEAPYVPVAEKKLGSAKKALHASWKGYRKGWIVLILLCVFLLLMIPAYVFLLRGALPPALEAHLTYPYEFHAWYDIFIFLFALIWGIPLALSDLVAGLSGGSGNWRIGIAILLLLFECAVVYFTWDAFHMSKWLRSLRETRSDIHGAKQRLREARGERRTVTLEKRRTAADKNTDEYNKRIRAQEALTERLREEAARTANMENWNARFEAFMRREG